MKILFSSILVVAISATACSGRQPDDSIKVVDSIPATNNLKGNDTITPLSDSSFMKKDSVALPDSSNMSAKEQKFKELSDKKKSSQDELKKRIEKGTETQFHPHILKGDTAK